MHTLCTKEKMMTVSNHTNILGRQESTLSKKMDSRLRENDKHFLHIFQNTPYGRILLNASDKTAVNRRSVGTDGTVVVKGP